MATEVALTVRPIGPEDRNPWQSLFQAYGVFYKTDFTSDICDNVWDWLMSDNHPVRGFIAGRGDSILGFAHLRAQHDTFSAGPSWFLDDLFTTPEARGQGVATSLISHLKHYASTHGGGTLRWITAADNHTAQHLYDSLAQRTSWVVYQDQVPGSTS